MIEFIVGLVIVVFAIILGALVAFRFYLSVDNEKAVTSDIEWAYEQFIGEQQVQSDYGKILKSSAGVMGVLADGIGKNEVGKVASKVAVDAIVDLYEGYQVLSKPEYFLKRCFRYANIKIHDALGDRHGGASLACTVIIKGILYYVLAGNIQIYIFRNGELIPLSEGHTINKLTENAYNQGRLNKQIALYTMKEKRLWNYVGLDGFSQVEIMDIPVKLEEKDRVVMMTKGIYEVVSPVEIEEVLSHTKTPPKKQAKIIIEKFRSLNHIERDNGTIMITSINKIIEG